MNLSFDDNESFRKSSENLGFRSSGGSDSSTLRQSGNSGIMATQERSVEAFWYVRFDNYILSYYG